MKWLEMEWNEMEWNEMKWNEMELMNEWFVVSIIQMAACALRISGAEADLKRLGRGGPTHWEGWVIWDLPLMKEIDRTSWW